MLKLSQLNMDYVNNCLTGRQFEYYCANLINSLSGYLTVLTPAAHDHGVDIIFKDTDNDNAQVGVQVKLNNNTTVGYSAEEEAIAGVCYYNLDYGIVLTNSHFTNEAKESAKRLHLILWNKDDLKGLIKAVRKKLVLTELSNIGLSHKSLLNIRYLTNEMGFKNYQSLISHMIRKYKINHTNINTNTIKMSD